jgi:deferrochelatase/peroxidase EfeB
LVAAKMIGRWLSGCSLDLSPDKDAPAIAADPQRRNNFSNAGDEQGLRCPIGALRRSNPRTTHLKHASEVRRHRLIRRGIECGPHLQNSAFRTMGLTVA